MSKKKKEPIDWDKLFRETPELRPEDLPDPTCVLVKPLPPVPEGNFDWALVGGSADPVNGPRSEQGAEDIKETPRGPKRGTA